MSRSHIVGAFGIVLAIMVLVHCSSRCGTDDETTPTHTEAPMPNDQPPPTNDEALTALRAALERVRSVPADEHLTTGPLEASALVGMTRTEIEQVLGEPGQCRVASQPTPCRSESDVFYSFYHLPEGSVGGGPELLLRFEGERCASAEWRFTQ